jgi:tetratricopeptide (TPR) repeat protein
MFHRSKPYNRAASLAAAQKAVAKGRVKRAIAEYSRILEHQPDDFEVRGRLAPLQAKRKLLDAAWSNFKAAAQGYERDGFLEKALSVYRQAAHSLPDRSGLWEMLADLHLQRHHSADALAALREGAWHFGSRSTRHTAIRLLEKAHRIAPEDFETGLELGRLLARAGRRPEALALLDGLAKRQEGRRLRQIRALLFRLRPTPARAWHWLRAALEGRGSG